MEKLIGPKGFAMWIHWAPDAPVPTGLGCPPGQGDGSVQPGLSCVCEKAEGPWVSCPSSLPGPGFLGASDVPSLQPSRWPAVRLGPTADLPRTSSNTVVISGPVVGAAQILI